VGRLFALENAIHVGSSAPILIEYKQRFVKVVREPKVEELTVLGCLIWAPQL
jgi:hypothetical protein